MQNRSALVLCALTLLVGFLMICLGAFFLSSSSVSQCQRNLVTAYVLLPLGFVILLSGIFWSTYRQANENKGVFGHVLRQHLAPRDLPLATVDRPDFYPPTYEDSLGAEKRTCPVGGGILGIPPPLYTETSLEFQVEDENDGQPEAPPSYQDCATEPGASAPAPRLRA